MNIEQILRHATVSLKDQGIDNPSLDARILLQKALNVSIEYLILHSKKELSTTEQEIFNSFLKRRLKREPISHILEEKEFFGINFKVDSNTLTPRPDTETLIETVFYYYKDKSQQLRILDLGTGTGCILLTLLKHYENAYGVGVDISMSALKIAKQNSEILKLIDRVQFINTRWGEGIIGEFDIIVSNPPYIPILDKGTLSPEVREYEPHIALFGGDDGLECYRDIAKYVANLLKKDGYGFFEGGIHQSNDIANIMTAKGLEYVGSFCDLAGIERCIVVKNNR